MSMIGCPDETTLLAFAEGNLPSAEAERFDGHIARCPHCQQVLRLFASTTASARPPAPTGPPVVSDRYALRSPLGRGGQGAVWRAWDHRLERDVALKFVAVGDQRQRMRLQREARALAQLNHPHVLEIFDVELSRDPGFISTMLCEGSLADEVGGARPWRATLETMRQVAEGLAAVHDLGLLHRDIKPSNLLRAPGGVVKIGDFGLAATLSHSATWTLPGMHASPELFASSTTFCGTLGYLAPEIAQGRPHDIRSDQYAFFVSLHQLLTGYLPQAKRGWSESRVPRWLRKVVDRGLSHDPSDRFSSMETAISALWQPGRRRRIAAVAVVAIGLAGVSGFEPEAVQEAPSCPQRVPARWSASMHTAIETSAHPQAAARADDLERMLVPYIEGWQASDTALCTTGRVEGRRCLWWQAERVHAIVERLAEGSLDAAGVDKVVRLMPEMISFEHCVRQEERGLKTPAVDTVARARAAAVVHGGYAKSLLGDLDPGGQAGSTQEADRSSLEPFPDLHATALRREASRSMARADREMDEVIAMLDRAEQLAIEADAPVVQARVIIERSNAAFVGADEEEAERQVSLARAVLARAGQPAPELMRLALIQAGYALYQKDAERALRWAREAREYAIALNAEGVAGQALMLRSTAFLQLNQSDEALASMERALVSIRGSFGADHPTSTEAEFRLARALLEGGRFLEAVAILERLVDQLGRSHPGSLSLGRGLIDLGNARMSAHEFEGAHESIDRARAIYAEIHDEFRVATADISLAELDELEGNHQAAALRLARASVVLSEHLGPEHPTVVGVLDQLHAAERRAYPSSASASSISSGRSTNSGGSSAKEHDE